MTDPRKLLTEETPETPEDLSARQLTEVGGSLQSASPSRILTEDLPEEDDEGPKSLLG